MVYTPEPKMRDDKPIEFIPLICQTCGHSGSEVEVKQKYIGGQGYQDVIQCKNEKECWERWDKKNG